MVSQSSARSKDSSGAQCAQLSSCCRPLRKIVKRVALQPNVLQCSSERSFSCQQTLLIVLNSHKVTNKYITHCISASNSRRRQLTLESPIPHSRRLPLSRLLSEPYFRYVQPRHIQQLFETTTNTVHLLHRHNISFPISLDVLSVVLPANYAVHRSGRLLRINDTHTHTHPANYAVPTNGSSLPLVEFLSQEEGLVVFFEYNRFATHLSRKHSSTRRTRQKELELNAVASLMAAVHALLRLRDAPASYPVDASSQAALGSYLASDDATMAHACLINKIANPTPWLAVMLSFFFLAASDFAKCRAVLDAALGGCDAAPRHMVDPGDVLSFYAQRRRIRHEEMQVGDKASDLGLDVELDGEVLARLLVYYITATNMRDRSGNRHRWRDAVIMFDAYLTSKRVDDSILRGFVLDERTDQERELLRSCKAMPC
ncbi:hypothetical protein B0T21DRAFT_55484 [Apiosordaria backusii]|uniref:Uncharacterized protein n=1 Tax=Apiosordaria backusii TaxID=314023 RepID=A0AA40AMU3_9PEZI|nr:hypothetical protein B0T21DRAFT_55484 [Apiosordaria backusii]